MGGGADDGARRSGVLHVGAWTLMRVVGRYVLRAHVRHTHRVRTVYVPPTRYVFRAYVLPCQHVSVGQANRTCWGSNMYGLPEGIVRVAVPTCTCCPSRSYALMYQPVRVACADHACHFTEVRTHCHPYPSSLAVARDPLQVQGAAPLAL